MGNRYIETARAFSTDKLQELQGQLAEAACLVDKKACVYATGSFGRLEAGQLSDLDLFIVVDKLAAHRDKQEQPKRALSNVAEIKLKSYLINAVEKCNIASFDGDGKYLESHIIDDFVSSLGSRQDDALNTLTGRLLLVLESKILIGDDVYNKLIDDVVDAYFIDYKSNNEAFLPSFLINDVLRMWRTFCVNYEFSRRKDENDARIKNLKLKYSRMITCYSAIIYLLSIFARSGSVRPEDVKAMVALTPTQRLAEVQSSHWELRLSDGQKFGVLMQSVTDHYSEFLSRIHVSKDQLRVNFRQNEAQWKSESYDFGRMFAKALSELGDYNDNARKLYRIIVI